MSQFLIATHALVFLTHKGGRLSSAELAENINVHPVQVRRVCADLVKAGLMATSEGRTGGYVLTCDPQTTTLRDVARATHVEFISGSWDSGEDNRPCPISSGMSAFAHKLKGQLEAALLNELGTYSIAEIEHMLITRSNQ